MMRLYADPACRAENYAEEHKGAECDQAAAACVCSQMQYRPSWVDASYDGDLIIAEQLWWQKDTDKERGLQKEGAALVR